MSRLATCLLAVAVAAGATIAASPAEACDCPRVDYEARWADAALVVLVRGHEPEAVVEVSEDGTSFSMTETKWEVTVLHALKGDAPATLGWSMAGISNCWPGLGEDKVGLLFLDDPADTPNICRGDGLLEWLMDSELPTVLRAAGAEANEIDAARVEQALRATSFMDYLHERKALQIVLPSQAGQTFALRKTEVRFVREADDENERIEVLTALEHEGLAFVELHFPAEGVVVRAVLFHGEGDKWAVAQAALVER